LALRGERGGQSADIPDLDAVDGDDPVAAAELDARGGPALDRRDGDAGREGGEAQFVGCLLYTSPSPRD